jgi:hypothetical protein
LEDADDEIEIRAAQPPGALLEWLKEITRG